MVSTKFYNQPKIFLIRQNVPRNIHSTLIAVIFSRDPRSDLKNSTIAFTSSQRILNWNRGVQVTLVASSEEHVDEEQRTCAFYVSCFRVTQSGKSFSNWKTQWLRLILQTKWERLGEKVNWCVLNKQPESRDFAPCRLMDVKLTVTWQINSADNGRRYRTKTRAMRRRAEPSRLLNAEILIDLSLCQSKQFKDLRETVAVMVLKMCNAFWTQKLWSVVRILMANDFLVQVTRSWPDWNERNAATFTMWICSSNYWTWFRRYSRRETTGCMKRVGNRTPYTRNDLLVRQKVNNDEAEKTFFELGLKFLIPWLTPTECFLSPHFHNTSSS